MKKYFLIILFATCSSRTFSQSLSEGRARDSIVVDSLRKLLPLLKDSSKVDCLNMLSERSISLNGSYNSEEFKRSADSIFKYASLAYNEASRLNYKYGKAVSLLNLRLSYAARSNFRDSAFEQAIKDSLFMKYTRQAFAIAKEVQSDELFGRVYYERADGDRIENYKKSIEYYRKAGNDKMELEVMVALVWMYTDGIEDETAVDYADKCIQLAKKIVPTNPWHHELIQWSYQNMADLYKTAGDYETALIYVRKSDEYGKATHGMKEDISVCELYYLLDQYDSALHYWQNWKKGYDTYYFGTKAFGNTLLGRIYLKMHEYDKAIGMFNESLNGLKRNGKYDEHYFYGLIRPLLFMGEAYEAKNNYQKALSFTQQGLQFAKKAADKPALVQAYELISRIYHELGNNDSAYASILQYIKFRDSVQNKQFIWRLNNYKKAAEDAKKESRIGFLNRDNQIKQQQLKQEATFRNFIIAAFIALLFVGLYVFRNINLKRKNERLVQEQKEQEWKLKDLESDNRHIELQKQSAELEMQALRAQMNPHFIFNSLSSINHFILKNESKTASNYLTRFSRLIRMVLINSQKPLITLEDELQMLELYLEMERLRFKNSFDYSITFLNTIDSDNILVPPLLLQPFCENAIWHGLMHLPAFRPGKEGQGRLDIQLAMENNILNCTITDNGIGREKAEEMKSKSAEKEKSMGLRITQGRLNLLNQEKGIHTSYNIEDLKDAHGSASGTRVNLKISCKETVAV
jgi:histidine kinase/tetratricopeptide repeat protein